MLAAVESPTEDQEYPEWIVASMPGTPDRTKALLAGGISPVPSLLRGLGSRFGLERAVFCLGEGAPLQNAPVSATLPNCPDGFL